MLGEEPHCPPESTRMRKPSTLAGKKASFLISVIPGVADILYLSLVPRLFQGGGDGRDCSSSLKGTGLIVPEIFQSVLCRSHSVLDYVVAAHTAGTHPPHLLYVHPAVLQGIQLQWAIAWMKLNFS